MIDWDVARSTAARLGGAGPEIEPAQAEQAVEQLRQLAAEAEGPVREYTGLHAGAGTAPVLVVDRARWSEANLASFEQILQPISEQLDARASVLTRAIGGRANGLQLGGVLAFMSSKVLGQFDPFHEQGRLLLVAPNIVGVERMIGADPRDFRAWVCLHEETHRVQFTANPWLREHVKSLIDDFIGATDVGENGLSEFTSHLTEKLGRSLKGQEKLNLGDLFQNDEQRELVQKMTGVMSLLEGHADVVMDGVGPSVIPSVASIRKRFEQRRDGRGVLDRLLRSLLGLDAKLRQYREGAEFVRAVESTVGLDGFNAVWSGPEQLPSADEIRDPQSWVARVHG